MIAHLLVTTLETARPWIEEYAAKHHILPEYTYWISPTEKELTIAQVREIQLETAYRIQSGRMFVIDRFETAAQEAQNAMLKTLEQPFEEDHFILICPTEQAAIPTIRSRTRIVHFQSEKLQVNNRQAAPSIAQLQAFHTTNDEDGVRTLIDGAIAHERQQLGTKNDTTRLRALLKLRVLLAQNITPQSIADSVSLLYYTKR